MGYGSLKCNYLPSIGMLPKECQATAAFLLTLNDLFDILNSSRPSDPCRKKRAFSAATEAEHVRALEEGRDWIRRWRISNGGTVHSIAGLQLTINAVVNIWRVLKDVIRVLCTRRLNQDSLENFFGCIRQVNGQNDDPNPTQFRHAYRKCSMTNLLKASDRGNCEPDADALLAVATAIASRPNRPVCEAKVSFKPDSGVVPPFEMDYATENVLTYIGGYLAHKEELCHACSQCTAALYSTNRPVRRSRETLLGLKGYTGLRSTDIGSLKAPSELFFAVVAAAYEVTETQVCSALGNHGVQQKLLLCVCDTDAYKALLIQLCSSNRLSQMMARFVRMQLHLTCARVSAQAGGKGAPAPDVAENNGKSGEFPIQVGNPWLFYKEIEPPQPKTPQGVITSLSDRSAGYMCIQRLCRVVTVSCVAAPPYVARRIASFAASRVFTASLSVPMFNSSIGCLCPSAVNI